MRELVEKEVGRNRADCRVLAAVDFLTNHKDRAVASRIHCSLEHLVAVAPPLVPRSCAQRDDVVYVFLIRNEATAD